MKYDITAKLKVSLVQLSLLHYMNRILQVYILKVSCKINECEKMQRTRHLLEMKNDIIDGLDISRSCQNYAYNDRNRAQKTHKDAVC